MNPIQPRREGADETLSRPEAIERLRQTLEPLTDEEHCLCSISGRLGIFCQGFRGLTDEQFRQRFDWIARKRPGASRQELESLVSLYHAGRQKVAGARALLRRRDARALRVRRLERLRQPGARTALPGADGPLDPDPARPRRACAARR